MRIRDNNNWSKVTQLTKGRAGIQYHCSGLTSPELVKNVVILPP